MYIVRILVVISLPLVALACTSRRPALGAPQPAVSAASDTNRAPPLYVGETEETLYGSDPLSRTRVRMGESQYLLRHYCESHGRYPATLVEVLPTPRSDWIVIYDFDGWDRPLQYRGNDRDYELRSAGPDRHFNTVDDVIGTGSILQVPGQPFPTVRQPNPCAKPTNP